MKPIDDTPSGPPQTGTDRDTITADIEHAFANEVRTWIDRAACERGYGRREAAAWVLARLREAARRM